jgi:hypothetical protein
MENVNPNLRDLIRGFSDSARNSVTAGIDPETWIEEYNLLLVRSVVSYCARQINSDDAAVLLQDFGIEIQEQS